MAKLILREDDGPEQEFSLDETGSLTVGRSPECDITIEDTQASRRHCTIVRLQSGAYEVADLGSTNGTLVNSTLIKKKKLRHGDVIRIGHHELTYDDPAAAGSAEGEVQNCCLVYARGERKGDRIELVEQRTTFGRKPTNTVVLQDTVCSSYHCEIVRDLNGHTIRDLGSTNGTLVNNEMITEAQLTHGARIRIGNTRFVFQDPAMAEIDLELAGVEDEEPEWGMMRELDLAAVRKRHPATLAYLGLFVVLIGALAYVMTTGQGRKEGQQGPQAPAGSLIEDWSFESSATAFAWSAEPIGTATPSITKRVKSQGRSALELRARRPEAEIFYSGLLPAGGHRYRLEARLGTSGSATAELGLLWEGLGLQRWAGTPQASGALAAVALVSSAPPWASSVRLGVRIHGMGSAYLDDLALVPKGDADVRAVELNEFRLSIVDGRSLTLSHAGSPVLYRGRLVAFDDAGKETDANGLAVKAEKLDDEHVLVTVSGGDAATLGLEFEEIARFLSQGGFRAFGYTGPDTEETYFQAAFPDEGRVDLAQVRKLLLGPSGRAFAVLAATPEGRLRSIAAVQGRRRTWTVYAPAVDGEAAFRFKFDLRGETALAAKSIGRALELHQARRWGEFLVEARRARAEFPFASKVLRDRLRDQIAQVTSEYARLERRIEAELEDYDEFRDLQSLDNVRAIVRDMQTRFQVVPGQGKRGERLEAIEQAEASRRKLALAKRQGKDAASRLEQALYIHLAADPPEVYSAAVLLAYVAWNLPDSEQAPEARRKLAEIEAEHPEVLAVLRELGLEKGN